MLKILTHSLQFVLVIQGCLLEQLPPMGGYFWHF